MTESSRKPRPDDSEEWEVVEDAPTRPLGSVVSVRFESDAARRVRAGASSLGLTLSEFVRRAAIAATESPLVLAKMERAKTYPYLVITGNSSLVWTPDPKIPGTTTGVAFRQPVPVER